MFVTHIVTLYKAQTRTRHLAESGVTGYKMNIAKTIAAKTNNANEAFNLAESRKHDVDQDWKNEATIYTFSDKSVLLFCGLSFKTITEKQKLTMLSAPVKQTE